MSRWSVAATLVLALVACGREVDPAGPNVVVISIDGLRPDHLSCYGYLRLTTPYIDDMAEGGALFTNHVTSSPVAAPAQTSLFTSAAPSLHGVFGPDDELDDSFVTLAESFERSGYRTAGFVATEERGGDAGDDQGFDRWETFSVDDPGDSSRARERLHERWGAFVREVGPRSFAGDEPFFAYVRFPEVSYDAPDPWRVMFDPDYEGWLLDERIGEAARLRDRLTARDARHLRARYDGEIRWVDRLVGMMREDLEAESVLDHTIIVLTSGYGRELLDHGGLGDGTNVYDEQIRVPLLISYPLRIRGRRHEGLTRSIDLGPTLRDLCEIPDPAIVRGATLAPIALGEIDVRNAPPALIELVTEARVLRSLRTESEKLVYSAQQGVFAWFDLLRDPGETLAIPAGGEARSRELLAAYEATMRRIMASSMGRTPRGTAVHQVADHRIEIERSLEVAAGMER